MERRPTIDPTIEDVRWRIARHRAEMDQLRARLAQEEVALVRLMTVERERSAPLQPKRRSLEERTAEIRDRAHLEADAILTNAKVSSLASLLQIPAANVDEFRALLRYCIACEIIWRAPEYAAARRLKLSRKDAARVVKTGDAFLAALKCIPPSLRRQHSLELEVVDEIRRHRTGRGRPRQIDDCPRYAEFVRVFIAEVRRMGGSLTLTRSRKTGTLPAALAELRPLLPAGFIPADLRLKTLEEYMQKAKKAVKKRVPKIAPDSWVVPPTDQMRH